MLYFHLLFTTEIILFTIKFVGKFRARNLGLAHVISKTGVESYPRIKIMIHSLFQLIDFLKKKHTQSQIRLGCNCIYKKNLAYNA